MPRASHEKRMTARARRLLRDAGEGPPSRERSHAVECLRKAAHWLRLAARATPAKE